MHYNYKVGSIVGTAKLVLKVKYNKDEGIKLIVIASCETTPKFTTHFYKR